MLHPAEPQALQFLTLEPYIPSGLGCGILPQKLPKRPSPKLLSWDVFPLYEQSLIGILIGGGGGGGGGTTIPIKEFLAEGGKF